LVSSDENKLLHGIERLIKKDIPKVAIDGFDVDPEDIKVAAEEMKAQLQRRQARSKRGAGGSRGSRGGQGRSRNASNRNASKGNAKRSSRSR
jgi:ATP-dependent RNA helicase RhlE